MVAEGSVRYRFLAAVGEGGFGRVYRARMEASDGFHKDVAIKVLSDLQPPQSLLERFRDEARMLGLVRDRAIVGVEPPIRIGERWAVVMDFVDGCSCAKVLENGPLPPGVAVEIVGEVARALHSAYAQEGPEGEPLQLLHRDIKPENIQITPSGDVRVLDFGIARANFAAREFKTRHAFGGTPGYIAPERLNRVEVAEGDVYSLGVVLHELITGERPSFPPTVDVNTVDQAEGAGGLPASVAVDKEDLQLPDALRNDPHVMEALKVAAWMRTHDHQQRPSPRQVEDACGDLRRRLPAPYFRGWAEAHVPHRIEIDGDDMVGQVLTTSVGMPAEYSLGGLSESDSAALQRDSTGGPPGNQGLALGAMLGGGVVMLVSGVVVLLIAAGLGVYWWLDQSPSAEAEAATTALVPMVEVPGTGEPDEVVHTAEPSSESTPELVVEPPRPRVAPPVERESPRRMVLTVDAPVVPAASDDAPYEMPSTPREPPKGTLLLATKPSGASVYKDGEALTSVGRNRYELPHGPHRLEIRSSTGKTHNVAVDVPAGSSVELCWDFEAERACGP